MQTARRHSFLALFGAAIFALIPACSRDPGYSQSSPEATIATAQQMVRKGDAKLLVKLIYSDDEGMRRCLNRLGHTLGHLQDLAIALNRAFPEEARKLKEEAKSQTAKGGVQGLVQVFTGASRSGQQRQSSGSDQFSAQLTRIFTAPYQVLARDVNKAWNWTRGDSSRMGFTSTSPDLARALRRNPHLKVLAASGRYDLGTPYSASDWSLAQLDAPADVLARVTHRYYDAGHMMYTRQADLAQLKVDVAAWMAG